LAEAEKELVEQVTEHSAEDAQSDNKNYGYFEIVESSSDEEPDLSALLQTEKPDSNAKPDGDSDIRQATATEPPAATRILFAGSGRPRKVESPAATEEDHPIDDAQTNADPAGTGADDTQQQHGAFESDAASVSSAGSENGEFDDVAASVAVETRGDKVKQAPKRASTRKKAKPKQAAAKKVKKKKKRKASGKGRDHSKAVVYPTVGADADGTTGNYVTKELSFVPEPEIVNTNAHPKEAPPKVATLRSANEDKGGVDAGTARDTQAVGSVEEKVPSSANHGPPHTEVEATSTPPPTHNKDANLTAVASAAEVVSRRSTFMPSVRPDPVQKASATPQLSATPPLQQTVEHVVVVRAQMLIMFDASRHCFTRLGAAIFCSSQHLPAWMSPQWLAVSRQQQRG